MKDDPFSTLAGLDQQLFKDNQGNKQTSGPANKQASRTADRQRSKPGTTEAGPEASRQADRGPSGAGELLSRGQAGLEARRTPASLSSGHRDRVRIEARHTYDIFQDQVRWMNHTKLDIEDAYEEKLTINGIVKLALDVLRDDFEANGEDSVLMRVLVFGRRPPVRGEKGGAG